MKRKQKASTQMDVKEVMAETGIGRNKAYELIQKLNAELEAMGKITFKGRINRQFFEEKVLCRP
jgi:predicted DNA-binding transcriptional regulator AlpA